MSESFETTCPLDRDQVSKAISALKCYISKQEKEGVKKLIGTHESIFMLVNLHRIPALKKKNFYIKLPFPIFGGNTEICLITKDVDEDSDKSAEHFKSLLAKFNISVSEILPIRRLKLEYRSYEAKRKLCDMYDLFLCDKDLLYRMPSLLGKYFIGKRRDPRPIDMSCEDLAREFDKTISQSRWFMSGNGSSSKLTVAKTDFPISHIVENILTCAVTVAKKAPRGWNNVHSIHLRTDTSLALPVYVNDTLEDVDDLDKTEINYLTTLKKRKLAEPEMWKSVDVYNPPKQRRKPWTAVKK